MKERVGAVMRTAVLALAASAFIVGVAEARATATANRSCIFVPPYYVGACVDDPGCKDLCEPYWPRQGVGGCLSEPLCCVCE